MKIRIFALARDLGLDSKVLIDLCEQAGVKLRNALATISEEERDTVVAFIRSKGAVTGGSTPPVEMTPVRDVPLVAGKVRQIVGIPSRVPGRNQDDIEDQADDLEDLETAEVRDSEIEVPVETVSAEESPVSESETQVENTPADDAVATESSESPEMLPNATVDEIRVAQNDSEHLVRNVDGLVVLHKPQVSRVAARLAFEHTQSLQHPVHAHADEHHRGLLESLGAFVNLSQVQGREVRWPERRACAARTAGARNPVPWRLADLAAGERLRACQCV